MQPKGAGIDELCRLLRGGEPGQTFQAFFWSFDALRMRCGEGDLSTLTSRVAEKWLAATPLLVNGLFRMGGGACVIQRHEGFRTSLVRKGKELLFDLLFQFQVLDLLFAMLSQVVPMDHRDTALYLSLSVLAVRHVPDQPKSP